MVSRRLLSCLAFLLLASSHLQAQLQVDLKLARRLYMAYAPVMASVVITNYSGRDIVLENTESENWLSFQITNGEGTLVAARSGKTRFDPRTLHAGETCRFAVNLVNSYPVTEFGPYHVQANIYFAPMAKFFSSPRRTFEVSEGKVIWEQSLGVPDGEGAGGERQVSLLTFRDSDENELYARVEDREGGVVYLTQKLGRLVAQGLPQIEVDPSNNVHVLQLVSPKTYLYSRIGLHGEPVAHLTYYEVKTRPKLRRMPNGEVGIAGGQVGAAPAEATGEPSKEPAKAKISDRPVQLPPE